GLGQRLLDRLLHDVVDPLHRVVTDGARPALHADVATRPAAPAGCLEVVGDEQHLDATLHERTQHPVEPGDAAVARTDGVAQPLDGGRLLLPLDLRLDLHRSKADVVVARVYRNGDARRDALAKVGVELALETAGGAVWRADGV